MAKIEERPLGEYILAETEIRDNEPTGDCMEEGGSDWRKDAGEEGGATNGSIIACTWLEFSVLESIDSGTRTAWLISFLFLGDPKHQYVLNQLPHLLFCM